MDPLIIDKINSSGIIAVLVVNEVKHAVPLANVFMLRNIFINFW